MPKHSVSLKSKLNMIILCTWCKHQSKNLNIPELELPSTYKSIQVSSACLCWALNNPQYQPFHSFPLFLLHLRSVLLVRGAATEERQTTGLQPIIRNEKGMNCKASFHCEMPKYRHFVERERDGEINWPAAAAAVGAVGAVLLFSSEHSGWWWVDSRQLPLFPCSFKHVM